jgi:uncharacterized membrane protein (UPF0127 family)
VDILPSVFKMEGPEQEIERWDCVEKVRAPQKSSRLKNNTLIYSTFLFVFHTHAQDPTINIANKVIVSVEIARTPEERNKGLMFRRFLSPKHGMLFCFNPPQKASMWMKNTYVSLDILFVSPKGVVVQMSRNVRPLSEKGISCPIPVSCVLELPAGTCKKHRVRKGDRVLGLKKAQQKTP